MIVADYRRFGGYGMYRLKAKPVFLWNLLDRKRTRWERKEALARAQLIKQNPPYAADAPLLARLERIGLTPGKDFDRSKLSDIGEVGTVPRFLVADDV
jgi:hypothetical protein